MRLGTIEAEGSTWAKFMAFFVDIFLTFELTTLEIDCPLTTGL